MIFAALLFVPALVTGTSLNVGPMDPMYFLPDYASDDLPAAALDSRADVPHDGEHIQHSSLWGHQYIAGGAGEGTQYLAPDGSIHNKQGIKTDAVLPAYCEPPNPCPPGLTSEDGCLEQFENTADFSRTYQEKQDCMCDEDHMFNCPTHHKRPVDMTTGADDDLETAEALDRLLQKANVDSHKGMVAKKFFVAKKKAPTATESKENPFMHGEKLAHIVAKKG